MALLSLKLVLAPWPLFLGHPAWSPALFLSLLSFLDLLPQNPEASASWLHLRASSFLGERAQDRG